MSRAKRKDDGGLAKALDTLMRMPARSPTQSKARRVETNLLWAWQKPDGTLEQCQDGYADLTRTRKSARILCNPGERVVRVRVTVEVVDEPR